SAAAGCSNTRPPLPHPNARRRAPGCSQSYLAATQSFLQPSCGLTTGGRTMPVVTQRRAIERLWERYRDHVDHCPDSNLSMVSLFSSENISAVRSLNLYAEYDARIDERLRRHTLLNAWGRPRVGRMS